MENNNPIEDLEVSAPVETVEAPVAEPVVEPVVEEPAKVEEAPEATEEPAVLSTDSFARSTSEKQGVGAVANGAIGVAAVKPQPKKSEKAKEKAKKDKVAIHSTKNVTWAGVGKVYRGYNIVDIDAAEKWLTRDHCRKATPEEVAKEFGK